jgi:hypothetical protein
MIISKASLLSLRTHTIWERNPWRVAFWAERALPSGVVGPWDSAPLARLAAIFFSDVIFILVLDDPALDRETFLLLPLLGRHFQMISRKCFGMWEKEVVNGFLGIWFFGGGWRKSFVGRGLGGENLGDARYGEFEATIEIATSTFWKGNSPLAL